MFPRLFAVMSRSSSLLLLLLLTAADSQRAPRPAPRRSGDSEPPRPRGAASQKPSRGSNVMIPEDLDGPMIDIDLKNDPKMEGWQPQFSTIEIENAIQSLRDLKAGAREVHYNSLRKLLAEEVRPCILLFIGHANAPYEGEFTLGFTDDKGGLHVGDDNP